MELDVNDDDLVGYAIFDKDDNRVKRVLLIDFALYTSNMTMPRNSREVTLTFDESVGEKPRKATVKTLFIGCALVTALSAR